MPVNKYYFLPTHCRMRFDDVARILSEHGYFSASKSEKEHALDYYRDICNCGICHEIGLFLLDNYAKKDYTEYRVKYQKLVDKDLAYRTFFGAQEIDFKSLWSEETSKTLNSIFSDEAAHSKK